MDMLYDMHCHLDFAEGSEGVARASHAAGIVALSCTVVPSSYVSDVEKFQGCDDIHLSLGLHPWWIADRRVSEVDIARFESLVADAPFVGEIGLDLASSRKDTKARQIEVLERILASVHAAGDGRVLTFHAVHAASVLMDALDRNGTNEANTCLFHWFQGSHEEFGRALSMEAMMSVGMRMMATERGAAFAAAIPEAQLLVETDSPPHEGSSWDVGIWTQEMTNTITALAELRGCSRAHLMEVCAQNSERVLRTPFM